LKIGKINVEEFCIKNDNCKRLISASKKQFGTTTETITETEHSDIEKREIKKQKKTKYDEVWALPEDQKELINAINKSATKNLEGLIQTLIKATNPHQRPPEGRLGLTYPATIIRVRVHDIQLGKRKNNQFIQFNKVKQSYDGSAFPDYADTIDFTANVDVDSPMFDRKNGEELFRQKIIPYIDGGRIGAFHGAAQKGRITLVD